MRDATLPDALLFAALGLALSFATPRQARQSAAMMAAIALLTAVLPISSLPISGLSDDLVFTSCWLTLFLTAATVHLPESWRTKAGAWLPWGLSLNAGLWAGLVTHIQGGTSTVLITVPLLLLFIPGAMMVKRGWGIALKVACSWLMAIALLETGLNFVPTPGYKPDHMD